MRLHLSRDFERTFRDGRRIQSHNLTVYIKNNNLGYSRLGIVVSKKVGKSVVRNKIKRRIREIFRIYGRVLFKEGYDVIFVVKKDAVRLTFHELLNEIVEMLS